MIFRDFLCMKTLAVLPAGTGTAVEVWQKLPYAFRQRMRPSSVGRILGFPKYNCLIHMEPQTRKGRLYRHKEFEKWRKMGHREVRYRY